MTVRDFAEGINPNSIQQGNAALDKFKKDVELLAGYYEGGGRVLADDLPNITQELDDKLNNHFMGGDELSIEDYRELWKLMEFYNDKDGVRMFRPKTQTSSPSSPATQASSLANRIVSFDTMEAKAESDRIKAEKEAKQQAEANKPLPPRPKSAAYESALKPVESRMAQFKRVFSPQQIKDRGAMISDIFSRMIDENIWDEMDSLLGVIYKIYAQFYTQKCKIGCFFRCPNSGSNKS